MDYIKISRERMVGEDAIYAEEVIGVGELDMMVLSRGEVLEAIVDKLGRKLDKPRPTTEQDEKGGE
jgi:hypothetical protein